MHILVFPSFYPSRVRPQTGIFFKEQVLALRKAGHQTGVLVAPRLWETLSYIREYQQLPQAVIDEGEQTYRMHRGWFPRIFPIICAILHGNAGFKAFENYVNDQGMPDIIHAHNIFYSGYMAVRIGQKYDLPVVLTEHSTNYLRGRIFLPGQHLVAKYTLNRLEHALAVGKRLATTLNERYQPQKPVRILHNIVDTDFFSPQAGDGVFTFAALGQMKPRKRFKLLIRSFAQMFKGKPVKLIIGGSGPEYSDLQNLINDLGVVGQIELPGQLNREQVRDLCQSVHVIVSSSVIETFGVTLIEAMSCGKPVIATRSGGPEDFVTPDTGILVPVDDQDALAKALQQMHNTYSSFDPSVIRSYCVENFSEASIVKQLETLYHSTLQDA